MTAPDSFTLSIPPRRISFRTSSPIRFCGNITMFSALIGFPPIAYTSLKEFAAAICPNSYGSEQIGGKKSVVCIRAISSVSFHTPASSCVLISTRSLSCFVCVSPARASVNWSGGSFAEQPPYSTVFSRSNDIVQFSFSELNYMSGFSHCFENSVHVRNGSNRYLFHFFEMVCTCSANKNGNTFFLKSFQCFHKWRVCTCKENSAIIENKV